MYLSDFGLTKRSSSDSGITGTGQFVGTLDYAAPEQFKGGIPDARTDVYSLGCVLFECLTGHPPFRSENDAGLMYAHLQEPPPAVTDEKPKMLKEIDAVITKAMAKAPEDRPASAGGLVDEAARALHVGVRANPRGPRGPACARSPPSSRWRSRWSSASWFRRCCATTPRGRRAQPVRRPPRRAQVPRFRRRSVPVDRALSDTEEQLLTYIPEDVSTGCLPLDRQAPIHGERASLVCRTADLEVLYELFQTRDEMNEAFQVNVNNKTAPEGDCATDHLAVGPVHDRRCAGRRRPVLHGSARAVLSVAAATIAHRMDGRERVDLRARDPERPGRPQPVRLVADILRSACPG